MKTFTLSTLLFFFFFTANSQDNYVLEWIDREQHFAPSTYFGHLSSPDNIIYIESGKVVSIWNGISVPNETGLSFYKCKVHNNQGELLWQQILGYSEFYGQYLTDFFVDQDQNIILLGNAINTWEDTYDAYTDFYKLSIDGELIFHQLYQSLGMLPGPLWPPIWNNRTSAHNIAVSETGDYYISGGASMLYYDEENEYENEVYYSPFISKFDNQGEELWTLYDSIPANGSINCFVANDSIIGSIHKRQEAFIFYKRNMETGELVDSTAEILLNNIDQIEFHTFYTTSKNNFPRDKYGNIYILYDDSKIYKISKLNTQGEILWEYQKPLVDTAENTYVLEVDFDLNGNVYCLGYYEGEESGMLLTKLDSFGNLIWEKQFNYEEDFLSPKDLDINGKSIFIAGNEENPSTSHSIFIIKYNPLGQEIDRVEPIDPENSNYNLISIDVSPNEDIYFSCATNIMATVGKLGKVTNLAHTNLLLNCKVFPNPFSGHLSIEIQDNNSAGPVEVQIVDLNGKIIINEKYNSNPITLKPLALPPGNYQLYVKKGKYEFRQKLIKYGQ
ncbi:MAG: T9SS C-terminal target domain-containing protein [Bacteroidetes bacterium]|nr:MAG: T9SS C-terminal target domain-containing protein [Bacteroidota bacterium]